MVSIGSITAAGRRSSEALMDAQCAIVRVSHTDYDGDGFIDDDDLDSSDNYVETTTPIYTGPCRIKFATNRVLAKEVQGQILAAQELLLYLPVATSGGVQVDDRATITDGGPDPAMTGRAFRITGLFSQTYATARRLPIESLS